jgi:hypothetical protein
MKDCSVEVVEAPMMYKLSMVIDHNIIKPCEFLKSKGAHIMRERMCPYNDAWSNMNTIQRSGLPFTSVYPNP